MAKPNDTDLQLNQIKQVESALASVEQRYQRLAILQKSIELKLIDPKDARNFDLFLKNLKSIKNLDQLDSLRANINSAAGDFDDLINYSKQFSKESEKTQRIFLNQNQTMSMIVSSFDRMDASAKNVNSKLNTGKKLLDDYKNKTKDIYDEWDSLDAVQNNIIKALENITAEETDIIKQAFGINSTYETMSKNILGLQKDLSSQSFKFNEVFDFDLGMFDEMTDVLESLFQQIGQETITINDIDLPQDQISEFLEMLSGSVGEMGNQMQMHVEAAKNAMATQLGLTTDVIDDMITDLQSKMIDPEAEILSPEKLANVSAAWQKMGQSGQAALMALAQKTSEVSFKLGALPDVLGQIEKSIPTIEKTAKTFSMLGKFSETMVDSLQYATRDVMPNWLYQTLGLDTAFQNIGNTASEGLKEAATNIAKGGSATAELSKFAGSFGTNLLKSLGVIGLITVAVTSLWNMMTAAGESVKEISTEFGVSSAMAYDMYKNVLNMTAALDNTTLKQQDVLDVLKKHRDEYGLIMDLNNKANQEAVKFAGELGKQYGIGAGEAYGFTQQLQQLGADQAASEEIAAVAAHASNLAGIPFSNVVKDLSESSEFVAQNFAGYPEKAVAAATKIRAMGGSLKQVEKAMEKAFDVSNFLKGMTELNMMTQGAVDLAEYFSLATSGADAATQFKELSKQFDNMVDSGQANVFNMRQFSDVTGQSSEEMMRGYKIRKMDADLGKDNVELLSKYVDKLSEADVADAKAAMKAAKKLDAAAKLDTVWASIKDTLTQALLPVLEGISVTISSLAPAVKILGAVIKGLVAPFKLIADLASMVSNVFTGDLKTAGDTMKSMFEMPKGPLDLLLKSVQLFVAYWTGKKLISGMMNVWNTMKGMSKTQRLMALGDMIPGGGMLKNIGSKASGMIPGAGMLGQAKNLIPGDLSKGLGAVTKNLGKIGGATAGLFGAFSGFQQQKEKGGTTGEAVGAGAIRGGAALAGAAIGTAFGGPIGTMIGGFLGDTIGGWVVDNAPGLVSKVGGIFDKLSGKFSKLAETWKPIFDKIIDAMGTMWEKIGEAIGAIVDVFMQIWDVTDKVLKGLGIGDGLVGVLSFLGDIIFEVVIYPLNMLITALGNVATLFTGLGQLLTGDFAGAFESLKTIVWDTLDALIPGDWFGSDEDSSKEKTDASLAKAASSQVDQMTEMNNNLQKANDIASTSNDLLKGLTDGQKDQLKDAGYSDELIKKLDSGELTPEAAIKQQFPEFKFSDDQLKAIANPATTPEQRDAIMASVAPSLAIGTNMVQSDGLAMLHKGEAVVPATVVEGGFNLAKQAIPTPTDTPKPMEMELSFSKVMSKLLGNNTDMVTPVENETESPFFKSISTLLGGRPNTVTPVANEMTDFSESAEMQSAYNSSVSSMQTAGKSPNQDALFKQLLTTMQDVANRPVIVQIGDIELKSLNKKMKTFNAT